MWKKQSDDLPRDGHFFMLNLLDGRAVMMIGVWAWPPWPLQIPLGFDSWDIDLIFLWHMYGIFMGYVWDMYGTCMGYLWDIHGISMAYVRDL